jgi:hypothetical protein
MGVYKPYVSMDGSALLIDRILSADCAVDPEIGPTQCVKVTDCTLPRIGQDPTITTFRLLLGQDALGRVAESLLSFHQMAYARAMEQEAA